MTNETKNLIAKFNKIANNAVRKAQERHRELGIPNVYSINGIIVYEYNGKISMNPPKWWKDFNPSAQA